MKFRFNIIWSVILALFLVVSLVSCGDGGGGSSSTAPSLVDIAGVWDASRTSGQDIDENYIVFKINGQMVTYDYMGDSYDEGQNCYEKVLSIIKDLGNGKFMVVSEDGERDYVQISLSSNKLRLTGEEGNMKISVTWTRANLLESYFTPLCSDVYYPPPIPDYGSYY